MIRSVALNILLTITALLIYTTSAAAQITGATLSGVVTDPSDAVVAAAKVSIVNAATNLERQVSTSTKGLFTATDIPAGIYTVTISATGFSTRVEKNLELTVGGSRQLDAKLVLGEISSSIVVTSGVGDVELDTSTVSATVGRQRIVDLPLNGRDWTQLATLQPGVSTVRSQQSLNSASGSSRGVRGFGSQITANGHSPYENTYRIDGINENDYSNGAPGSPAGVNLGVDAIQEFNVITTAYTAEYGRTSGAVINAITRSGTNQVHGSAYVFDRDKIFDAESPFDRTVGKPTFHRVQFGGSLGGPIRKDKTFLFANYEGLRQTQGQTNLQIVPSLAARSGVIHNAGGAAQTVTVSAVAAKYLQLYPIPATTNAACFNDCGNVFITGNTSVTENFITTRFDQTLSAKDSLSLTYLRDNSPTSVPDALANTSSLLNAGRQVAAVTETHIFSPNLLNVVRFGYNRSIAIVNQPLAALTPEASDTTVGYFPGLAAPLLTIQGYVPTVGGYASQRSVQIHDNFMQFYDDVSFNFGNNALKFGFAYERIQGTAAATQLNGTATFVTTSVAGTALANFLQARPYAIDVLPAGSSTPIEPQDNLFAGYVQDDIRFSKRLVLNVGLRYEMLTIPTDRRNRLGLINTLTAPTGSAACPSSFVATASPGCTVPVGQFFQTNPTTHDFEPRVGFSYNPFGNGTTAIRGGFGIYDQLPLPYIYATYSAIAYPYAQDEVLVGTVPVGTFPFGDAAIAAAQGPSSHIGRYIDPNPKRDYSFNYNVNVEQQYGKHISTLVGYIGSHSLHTPFQASELNQVAPSQVQNVNGRYVYPITGATKQDVNAATIFGNLFDGAAHYNSLISQLKVSQFGGVTFQATYTWNKCIDYGSSTQAPTTYQNSLPGLTYYNKAQRKGACDFDLPQTFSSNVLYEVPSVSRNDMMKTITSGFQVGAIVFANSGVPFTVVDNGDVIGQKGVTYASFPDVIPGCNPYNANFKSNGFAYLNSNCFTFPTALVGSALAALCNQQGTTPVNGQVLCTNVQGNERRNSLIGPRLVEADVSLIKNTHISRVSEGFNLQLRVEAFNVLNHSNFQAPTDNYTLGTSAYAKTFNAQSIGSAGVIDSLAASVRQLQFGAKVIF